MNEIKKEVSMSVFEIPVGDIAPNPYQPRQHFNDSKLSSLADSIRRYGVMQPIVVTQKPDGKYELISGERRLRASKLAGLSTIPAVLREHEHSNEEKFELAIIENVQREDLNPVDKAKAFKKLVDEFGLTHSQIAQKLGKSREYISNSLRLLALPDTILDIIARGSISEAHAKPLLMINDRPFEQQELLKKIISNNLTVRAASQAARSILNRKESNLKNKETDPELKNIEKKLSEKLGTRVHIDEKNEGEGGKLTIEYFSKEDLEKIINLVRGRGLGSSPILENTSDFLKNEIDDQEANIFEKHEPEFFKDEIELTTKKRDESDDEEERDDDWDGFKIFNPNPRKEASGEYNLDNNKEKFNNQIIDKSEEENSLSNEQEDFFSRDDFNLSEAIDGENKDSHGDKELNGSEKILSGEINNFSNGGFNDFKKIISHDFEKKSKSEENLNIQDNANVALEEMQEDKIDVSNNKTQENTVSAEGVKTSDDVYDNSDNLSAYEQFLKSKKKIEEQKKRIFENNDDLGSMSESALEAAGLENKINLDLEENNFSEANGGSFEESEKKEEEEFGDKEAMVKNIFAGDSFVPQKKEGEGSDDESDKNMESSNDNIKPGFGTFSI